MPLQIETVFTESALRMRSNRLYSAELLAFSFVKRLLMRMSLSMKRRSLLKYATDTMFLLLSMMIMKQL